MTSDQLIHSSLRRVERARRMVPAACRPPAPDVDEIRWRVQRMRSEERIEQEIRDWETEERRRALHTALFAPIEGASADVGASEVAA